MHRRLSMAIPAGSVTSSAPRPSLNRLLPVVLPSVALVLLLLLWDWAVRYYEIPSTLLARPGEVAAQLWYGARSGVFFNHTLATMTGVACGVLLGAVGGFILGALVAES